MSRLRVIPTPLKVILIIVCCWYVPLWGQGESDPQHADREQGQEFVIGVSDVLAVSVWREEELQAEVPVRPDGRIAVPLLGEVEVAGRTPLEVQAELTNGYKRFVAAPAVSLVVTEINSRKLFVLGEVAESGAFDLIRPTTVLQALAMAGGFTDFAKKDEVVIIRPGAGSDRRIQISVKAITSGRKPDDNLLLEPGDTVYVP